MLAPRRMHAGRSGAPMSTHHQQPVIESSRLILSWPRLDQVAGFYHDVAGTTAYDTLQSSMPASVEDMVGEWRERMTANPQDHGQPLHLAFIERSTDRMIGNVLWKPAKSDPRIVSIGYIVAPRWQRQGFASEALTALLAYGFGQRAAERVEARVYVGNIASRRLVERLGFRDEGSARRASCKNGVWVDHWVFAITRPDWDSNTPHAVRHDA